MSADTRHLPIVQIERFAALVEDQQREKYKREYPNIYAHGEPARAMNWGVSVKPGAKYTKVDVGSSGKYMVVNETGEIFGIKAYGVIHRGHQFGTLDTIHEWDWSGYVAVKMQVTA